MGTSPSPVMMMMGVSGRSNGDGHQPVVAPEAGDNTKVVLRPITNLVRRKNLDVVMIFSG